MLTPHHDGSPLYVSTQTPELGEVVRVRIRIPSAYGPVARVHTRSNPDREPRYTEASPVATLDGWDWWQAEVHVENPVHGYRWLLVLESGEQRWLNASGLHTIETLDVEDFKLVAHAPPPDWARSQVLYQVFPDRFARSSAADERDLPEWALPAQWGDDVIHIGDGTSTQFFGGDLAGIEEHLDHLQRLGVTLLYLTPVFPAQSNHRYDAHSFTHVDPLLGGNEAYISLIEAAHARGLRVIGDLTSNHSGDAHEWFRASHLTPGTPESEYYLWLDEQQSTYASWLGHQTLPKFNWNSQALRDRFIEGDDSIVARWLKPPFNLDGWRIDVANMTGRHLADDLNREVRTIIRTTMTEVNPDTILLGESTNDATIDFQGDAWHGAMTYANFTRPLWGWLSHAGRPAGGGLGMAEKTMPSYDGVQFFEAHTRFSAGFPWRVRLSNMNALDTHDTPRFLTHAFDGVQPVAVGLSMTMPGIPVVWAGDEFGLTGDDGEHSRTPMPWDELDEAEPIIDLYSTLIHLRTGHPALNGGGMRWLHVSADALVFVREADSEGVLVVATRAGAAISLDAEAVAGSPRTLFGDVTAVRGDDGRLVLEASGPSFGAFALPGVKVDAAF